LNPELLDGSLLLLIFTWKNTLISNFAVFPQNQALSEEIGVFKVVPDQLFKKMDLFRKMDISPEP